MTEQPFFKTHQPTREYVYETLRQHPDATPRELEKLADEVEKRQKAEERRLLLLELANAQANTQAGIQEMARRRERCFYSFTAPLPPNAVPKVATVEGGKEMQYYERVPVQVFLSALPAWCCANNLKVEEMTKVGEGVIQEHNGWRRGPEHVQASAEELEDGTVVPIPGYARGTCLGKPWVDKEKQAEFQKTVDAERRDGERRNAFFLQQRTQPKARPQVHR